MCPSTLNCASCFLAMRAQQLLTFGILIVLDVLRSVQIADNAEMYISQYYRFLLLCTCICICMQTLQVRAQLRGPRHCFVAPIQLPARFVPGSGEYVLTVKSVTVRISNGRQVPMQLSSTASVICMFVEQQ
jgi:hypothetical protein